MKLTTLLVLPALLLAACAVEEPDVCPASTSVSADYELSSLEGCSGHADFAVQQAAEQNDRVYLDSDPDSCDIEGAALATITQCGPWACDCIVVKNVVMTCPHGDCFTTATLEATCASDASACIGHASVYDE